MQNFPYVITISSEKGGVGKTTLATNLAIYLKALYEDLPVTIFSFDNHFTVDKMFQINGQQVRGTVVDLLLETPVKEIVHTGQYGVNYIPSSADLGDLKPSIKGPLLLARLLAISGLQGVILIDTRPDLDILTQNALVAADRVIIPVKDMASLENCRNIFEVFDRRGLDKKSLTLIPCLVDSRIKYEGPFKNQQDLLKAYAINRGYRCLDYFISKSPKVETLNTNPDGKIYPIITHAVGTDVHTQFGELANHLLKELRETEKPRSFFLYQWLIAEEGRKKEAFLARLEGLQTSCLFCGSPLSKTLPGAASFYFETSDDGRRGFIDDGCFIGFLISTVYGIDKTITPDDPSWLIFRESATDSIFVLRMLQGERDPEVEVMRYDFNGSLLSRKAYPFRESEGGILNREKTKLFRLMTETVGDFGGGWRNAFLLVHPILSGNPETILEEETYRKFSRVKEIVAGELGVQTISRQDIQGTL